MKIKKTSGKKKTAFPAMFFHSVKKEDIRNSTRPGRAHFEKQIWLWGGVGVVMAAIIFFWATTLPNRLKLDFGSDATGQLFKKNKDKLSELFIQNKKTMEFISATPELYGKILRALASSTSDNKSDLGLSLEQIDNLKNRLGIVK